MKDGKIYPKTAVTKEEFILMAYIALRANNCAVQTLGNKLALKIDIKKASCTPQDRACNGATLDATTSTYDYSANVTTTCSTGIKDYIWRFYNESTSEKIVKHGQYLDNFSFPSF